VKKSALCLGLAILLALASVHRATAAAFTVTSLADSGTGSLRQAAGNANALAGADDVIFAPGLTGTVTLTSGEILITDSLTVHGPGAAVLTVSGNDNSRIFHVENSAVAVPIDVTLSGLTLTHGFSALAGGAVFADSENLTILDSVVSNSTSGVQQDASPDGCGGNVGFFGATGGALRIANSTLANGFTLGINSASSGGNLCVFQGTLLLEQSTLSGGTADFGGGLFVDSLTADSTISLSTLSGNQGTRSGGGIFSESLGAVLTIDSSTISGNNGGSPSPIFAGFGGGIEVDQGTLRIINSTISGNRGNGGGGGIYFPGGAESSLLLRLTTVSNNTAGFDGGGILVAHPAVQAQLDHSIVANGTPQDVATLGSPPVTPPATFTVNYSLIETIGDVLVVGANNLLGVDPLLGPLANNGGPTLTHLPLPGSPVINAGNPAIPSPPPTDQRGFARIVGTAVDLGSVEVQPATVEVPALSQVGILILSALLFAAGLWLLRQARRKDGEIVAFHQRRGRLR
jgi:hypothetical protein